MDFSPSIFVNVLFGAFVTFAFSLLLVGIKRYIEKRGEKKENRIALQKKLQGGDIPPKNTAEAIEIALTESRLNNPTRYEKLSEFLVYIAGILSVAIVIAILLIPVNDLGSILISIFEIEPDVEAEVVAQNFIQGIFSDDPNQALDHICLRNSGIVAISTVQSRIENQTYQIIHIDENQVTVRVTGRVWMSSANLDQFIFDLDSMGILDPEFAISPPPVSSAVQINLVYEGLKLSEENGTWCVEPSSVKGIYIQLFESLSSNAISEIYFPTPTVTSRTLDFTDGMLLYKNDNIVFYESNFVILPPIGDAYHDFGHFEEYAFLVDFVLPTYQDEGRISFFHGCQQPPREYRPCNIQFELDYMFYDDSSEISIIAHKLDVPFQEKTILNRNLIQNVLNPDEGNLIAIQVEGFTHRVYLNDVFILEVDEAFYATNLFAIEIPNIFDSYIREVKIYSFP